MLSDAVSAKPRGLAVMLGWRRVRFTLAVSALFGLILSASSETPAAIVVTRAMLVGLLSMMAFGLFEQWPQRLPKWLAALGAATGGRRGGRAARRTARVLGDDRRRSAVRGEPEAGHRLFAPAFRWRAVRALDRDGCAGATARCLCAQPGAGVRAGAERARAQGTERAVAVAAGAGRATLPVQHPGQCAGAGGCRIAAGFESAEEPDRLSSGRGASPARGGDDAGSGAAACARLPRGDADAHAGSVAVRAADR